MLHPQGKPAYQGAINVNPMGLRTLLPRAEDAHPILFPISKWI